MTAQCKFKNGTCVHCGDTTQGKFEGWNGSDTNALMQAAKLALNALHRIDNAQIRLDHGERLSITKAIAALKQAGVQ